MDKEKLKLRSERILRIYFIDNELLVDVNKNSEWEEILNQIDYLSGELTMRSAMKKVCGLDCKKVFTKTLEGGEAINKEQVLTQTQQQSQTQQTKTLKEVQS